MPDALFARRARIGRRRRLGHRRKGGFELVEAVVAADLLDEVHFAQQIHPEGRCDGVPPIDGPSVPPSIEGAARESKTGPQRSPTPNDPLANIREREDRRSGFQYNSEPDVKKLI